MINRSPVDRVSTLFICFVVLGLAAAARPAAGQPTEGLRLGEAMPMVDRSLESATGGQLTLDDIAGENGTLVVFWAAGCPWVQRYEDRLLSIVRDYRSQGIGVVAVNPNDPVAHPEEALGEMRTQADRGGYPFPYVTDQGSALARAFGASRTPHVFLFGADRHLVYKGAIDDNPRSAQGVEGTYLRSALSALIGGTTIENTTTKPFGCTIKWQ